MIGEEQAVVSISIFLFKKWSPVNSLWFSLVTDTDDSSTNYFPHIVS